MSNKELWQKIDLIIHDIKDLPNFFQHLIDIIKEIEPSKENTISIFEMCRDMCRKKVDNINKVINGVINNTDECNKSKGL